MQKRHNTILGRRLDQPTRNERISQVRNLRTGEIFLTSNLFEKEINGEKFIGVFKSQEQLNRRDPNWMKKDLLVKHKQGV
ncbi:MAG: hypothetical protein N2235_05190 [Fischerella sp.]|nr:hypothetical protein [Fischerella sp.]